MRPGLVFMSCVRQSFADREKPRALRRLEPIGSTTTPSSVGRTHATPSASLFYRGRCGIAGFRDRFRLRAAGCRSSQRGSEASLSRGTQDAASVRESCRGLEAPGHRLAVQEVAVSGGGLEGVAEGVAEIKRRRCPASRSSSPTTCALTARQRMTSSCHPSGVNHPKSTRVRAPMKSRNRGRRSTRS